MRRAAHFAAAVGKLRRAAKILSTEEMSFSMSRLPERRMGKTTIRRFEEMKPKVEVVYNGKDQTALYDAYRLLARFFTEASKGTAGEAGEAR